MQQDCRRLKGIGRRTQTGGGVDEAVEDALAEKEHAVAHFQERAQCAHVVEQMRCEHNIESNRME